MRAGGCALQQALTAEAAGTVKQAVALAKRRGHAQVTPLHVANTMLAATTGLLRTACLQSHSHPLRCNALELCFNVALNRLPASSSSPVLGHHHSQFPSISNALVAAFKRAQAHQRRGSIENQQQPILAVKIELAHLIISILDDPSVSRVMREAGFSSTQVKRNVEKAVSSSNKSKENNLLSLSPSPSPSPSPPTSDQTGGNNSKPTAYESVKIEDINSIINSLMNKRRRSIVIVSECVSDIETVVRGVMNRVKKGEIPEDLRGVEFISIPPYSFCSLHREEVEKKMTELTCLLKSLVAKGVVLYLGDLKWILDHKVSSGIYCPVEHMIMELGRFVYGIGEIGRFWLMGIATFQTYRRCRTGHNSLETVWGLHPVTIPADSFGLSLISHSNEQIEARSNNKENGTSQLLLTSGEEKLTCRADYSATFQTETPDSETSICNSVTTSGLPPWLRNEGRRLNTDDQNCVSISMGEICRKWSSISDSVQNHPKSFGTTLSFSYASPQNPNLQLSHFPMLECTQPLENQQWPSTAPNSAASSIDIMDTDQYAQKFKEFTAENLNILCNELEKKVPRQKEIIPEIAATILQCRSGMLRRKGKKQETWLYFQGLDAQAKQEIARELAKIIFGSYSNFISVNLLSSFSSSTRENSIQRFAQEVTANPHRVFFVQDLENADYCSKNGIKRAIERGRLVNTNGEEFSLCDAIIILSSESSSRTCSSSTKQKSDESMEEKGCVSLDLNISFDDHYSTVCVEDQSIEHDVGLLENVDRCVVFKIQEPQEIK
ncbi:Double Clp-N motif-containing P-loop nucleoside triphosphate hydrolase superfamily protein [Forsythia ovata]|uniref:Double Clp-N motif-containing P-loop nucleoside triphosphate hydrolase superfamily protein n=1 Tax=Forsythia ovata TaxID=205694 RepID=A0ABD1WXK7_9LAMI